VKKYLRLAASLIGFVIAGVLLYNVFSSFDWSATGKVIASLTLLEIVIILTPFTVEVIVDCLAWRHLLPHDYHDVSLWAMFKARTGPEAVVMTMPMGPFISEPLKAWILFKVIQLKQSVGMVSVILRSCMLVLAQCSVVILITFLSFNWLQKMSSVVIEREGLAYFLLLTSLLLLAIYCGFLLVASRSSVIKKLHDKLEHSRFVWIRKIWESSETYFSELNEQFSTFGSDRKISLIIAYALYIIPWLCQGVEAYLILRVLGSDITVLQAFSVEAACGFLRSVAFIVPSGLGVEDASYFLMLNAAGVAHPLSAAFVIVKRLREILWITMGYGILFTSGYGLKKSFSGISQAADE